MAVVGLGNAILSGAAVVIAAAVLVRSRTTPSNPNQAMASRGIRQNVPLLGAALAGAVIFAASLVAAHVGNSVPSLNPIGGP